MSLNTKVMESDCTTPVGKHTLATTESSIVRRFYYVRILLLYIIFICFAIFFILQCVYIFYISDFDKLIENIKVTGVEISIRPELPEDLVTFLVILGTITSSDAFFLKWGSESASSPSSQKTWIQPLSSNMSPIRYQYMYSPYESHKTYQLQAPQYSQPELPMHQSMAPIPISIPAGASLTPVSLQHVQLVPCMCPVAPEEAEKLQEQSGAGPYVAQTYQQPSYTVSQPVAVASDSTKNSNKQ